MEDHFFDDYSQPEDAGDTQQQQQQQENNQQESQVEAPQEQNNNAEEDEYQQFEQPAYNNYDNPPTQSQNRYQQPSLDYYPEEVTPEMLEMKRKDQQINETLKNKASNQKKLKQQRKQKGKKQLQKLKSERTQNIQKSKTRNREENEKKGAQTKSYNNEWQKIVENIGLKSGEYTGNKDISRMKDAIIRKSKDSK